EPVLPREPDPRPGASGPPLAPYLLVHRCLLLLRFLQNDPLVRVAHTLALVGLGRPVPSELGRDLTHALTIDSLDDDFRLARRLDRDALGHGVLDRVREAEGQVQLLALGLRAIADADELELALEAGRDAGDHVLDQRPSRPGQGPREPAVGARRDLDGAVGLRDLDLRPNPHRQRALRPLDRHHPRRQLGGDVASERDRTFRYSRHRTQPLGARRDTSAPFACAAVRPLRNDAQHLAAVPFGTRLAIAHHAARSRHDRDSEPALHFRQLVLPPVHAQARPAHAANRLDHRAILVILQTNGQHGLAVVVFHRVSGDIALGLENPADLDLLLRRRQRHGLLARRLAVADARQEIGDRISHAHRRSPTSPARLRKPGDLAAHRRLAQLVARETEAPEVPVRPAADRTAV